ncbi:MAG: hypothetical protein KA144_03340 [Xanthomonadaceae bacterium]|nr:hypothetical protein [Xanthomonadaceae bacterium]
MKQQTTMSIPFSPQRGEKVAEGRMRGGTTANINAIDRSTPTRPLRRGSTKRKYSLTFSLATLSFSPRSRAGGGVLHRDNDNVLPRDQFRHRWIF